MTLAKYAKLQAKLHAAEHALMKAARKWDRLRAQVRRADRALDKEFKRRSEIGGVATWDDTGIVAARVSK